MGIGADIKIQHFLELQVVVVGDSTVDDLHEEAAHINADRHVVHYLFKHVLLGLDPIWLAVARSAETGETCPYFS